MKVFKIKSDAGFTLIETIIYMALYAIVIGGIVAGVYSVFDSSNKNATKSMVQEEGIFILGKIDWAETGANAVSVSMSNQSLFINRSGIAVSDNPLVFDLLGTNIRLARGTATPHVLNNSNVQVTNLQFIHTIASGDGAVPESVSSSFTLSAKTPNGRVFSQDFSATKYLRK